MKELLFLVLFLPNILVAAPRTIPAPIYVNKNTGSNANSCDAARYAQSAKQTISAGVKCLNSGDTLSVADGAYSEILVGQGGSGEAIIPNGRDAQNPTKIVGEGSAVIISPKGFGYPGGGGIITLFDQTQYLHFEGLRLLMDTAANSAGGVTFGGSKYITFRRNEIMGAESYASPNSRYISITGSYIHHAGQGCDTDTQRTPPCQHGLYVCGQNQIIEDNVIEYNANYGIQVSCEQGGIQNVSIQRNTVRYNRGVGIRSSGTNNIVGSNMLVGNLSGITVSGSGTIIAHNTIHGYRAGYTDSFGIYYDKGSVQLIADNILTSMPSTWNAITNSAFTPPETSYAKNNLCEDGENSGCKLVGQAPEIYTNVDAGDFTLKKMSSPAIAVGTPVTQIKGDITGRAYHTNTPSVGAYALDITTSPPQPPGVLSLNCSGALLAQGVINMRCVQEVQK